MIYTKKYSSPLGGILMAADDIGLIGVWFENQKYYADVLRYASTENDSGNQNRNSENTAISQTERWLDIYFGGEIPDFTPPIHMIGSDFRKSVWNILLTIPYGQTMTYGEIAGVLSKKKGGTRMSAQAVGGAVGHNPISIVIPCHRVVGTNGSLTGYAGGIDRKIKLLEIEKTDMKCLFRPKKGTAL